MVFGGEILNRAEDSSQSKMAYMFCFVWFGLVRELWISSRTYAPREHWGRGTNVQGAI